MSKKKNKGDEKDVFGQIADKRAQPLIDELHKEIDKLGLESANFKDFKKKFIPWLKDFTVTFACAIALDQYRFDEIKQGVEFITEQTGKNFKAIHKTLDIANHNFQAAQEEISTLEYLCFSECICSMEHRAGRRLKPSGKRKLAELYNLDPDEAVRMLDSEAQKEPETTTAHPEA